MTKMLSMCGLDCAVCPAFVAHKTDDQTLREKTAAEWSTQFHVEIKPADINCVGCLKVQGAHIGHCGESNRGQSSDLSMRVFSSLMRGLLPSSTLRI